MDAAHFLPIPSFRIRKLGLIEKSGRSLSPSAKCKDGYDAGNVEKGVRNTLRAKIGQGELTGTLVVLTHSAPARFRFGFACNYLW